MMAKYKHPDEECVDMTVLSGETCCGSVPCNLKGKMTKQVKATVRLNEFAELCVQITPEMIKDYAECGSMAEVAGSDGKNCDTCSIFNTDCLGMTFCEIPAIEKLLKG